MIYIVEDDLDIREMESYALKNSGFEVREFMSGSELLEACTEKAPSLILLDIMLPGEDGLSVLTRLRQGQRTKSIPVMMVTAKTTELDKVRGLDMGADDYLAKPFGILELVSRVKALLRRTASEDAEQAVEFDGISLDPAKRVVRVDDREVELTYKEFELLHMLLINQGLVLTREKIMDRVWDEDFGGESRTVDMHIKTLRRKLGEHGKLISTIRNVGYKLG